MTTKFEKNATGPTSCPAASSSGQPNLRNPPGLGQLSGRQTRAGCLQSDPRERVINNLSEPVEITN
jgi:hypothetical protein